MVTAYIYKTTRQNKISVQGIQMWFSDVIGTDRQMDTLHTRPNVVSWMALHQNRALMQRLFVQRQDGRTSHLSGFAGIWELSFGVDFQLRKRCFHRERRAHKRTYPDGHTSSRPDRKDPRKRVFSFNLGLGRNRYIQRRTFQLQ